MIENAYSPWLGPGGADPLNQFSGEFGFSDFAILKLGDGGQYQWHTFYGSELYDSAGNVSTDSSGNLYAIGESHISWDGPDGQSPLNAHTANIDAGVLESDILVMKLDSAGQYQWHTFMGGVGAEESFSIAVDENGGIYAAGLSEPWTGPGGEPPLNPHSTDVDAGNLNADICVIKLNSDGEYQWHTFQNGGSQDFMRAVAVDQVGNLYVLGRSGDWDGPDGEAPLNAHTLASPMDPYILKINSNGAYQWHTFFGADGVSAPGSIAFDASQNLVVAGSSMGSWNGPEEEAPLNAHSGEIDVFVLKLGSNGDYQWHTFFGAAGEEYGESVTVDGTEAVYVIGGSAGIWTGPSGEDPLDTYSIQ